MIYCGYHILSCHIQEIANFTEEVVPPVCDFLELVFP